MAAAGIASAQSPEWRFGGRVSWVDAGTTSDELGDTGSNLDLRSGFGVEFDATLMFSDLFGVELSIGTSAHPAPEPAAVTRAPSMPAGCGSCP